MSSPRARTAKAAPPSKPAAKKAPAKKAAAKPAAARSAEPSKTEKAAFLKAMVQGIKPGTLAAEKSAAKKNPGGKSPAAKKAKTPAASNAAPEAPKVEVLRRISGNASIPLTPESARALALAKDIEAALADGNLELLQPHALQTLLAALCKFYSANEDAGYRFPILAGRAAVTGTDAMIVCGALLKAVDLQVFELGMWQSWAGR